jgi:putative component of toxin-antitoxin plasmid stabilization module
MLLAVLALVVSAVIVAGCGGSKRTTASGTTTAATTAAKAATTATTSSSSAGGPGALQAEANSAAAGDIPDNQVFLAFSNRAAGYSMKYPEGWAQQGSGDRVTFRDKNNIVRIVVGAGAAPSHASVQADVAHLGNAQIQAGAQQMTISRKPAFKVVYSTESAPNAVTGKRVKLVVDRYYLWKGGRRAVVDLGTPEGVDNVDAYRLMIESFRWS